MKFLLIFCCLVLSLTASEAKRVTFNGEWKFALDYANAGEQLKWHNTSEEKFESHWDTSSVPHCWSIDPRYSNDVGAGWYRRAFSVPQVSPNERIELQFDEVFYHAQVWLNGTLPGEHDGGYTPFSFDVTRARKYPWWDYAGVIRDVELVVAPAVYIKNVKIHAEPDLASGTATVSIATWIAIPEVLL